MIEINDKNYVVSDDGKIHDRQRLKELQELPLERKIQITQTRTVEWYQHFESQVYVSFSGGKDSTVLADLTARICKAHGWKLTLVFVDTGLEYPEIRRFTKEFAEWLREVYSIEVELVTLRPEMTFKEVIEKYGYPVISKNVAELLYRYQNGSTSRTLLLSMDNNYPVKSYNIGRWGILKDSDIKVSDKCCGIMKKNPLKLYQKESGLKPIIGTMSSESQQRQLTWLKYGCNSFAENNPLSKPLSFWLEQDILQYLKKYTIPYCSVYGDIVEIWTDYKRKENKPTGKLKTTGKNRTGCMFCMFGVHMEKESRFKKMKITHPKQYEYCMRDIEDGGLGLDKVLNIIGVEH